MDPVVGKDALAAVRPLQGPLEGSLPRTRAFWPRDDARLLERTLLEGSADEVVAFLEARTPEQIDAIRTRFRTLSGRGLVVDVIQKVGTRNANFTRSMAAIYGAGIWALADIGGGSLATGQCGAWSTTPYSALQVLSEKDSATVQRVARAYHEVAGNRSGHYCNADFRQDVEHWGRNFGHLKPFADAILSRLDDAAR